ncbi:NUDIX hydrolase N-terminal domain-containing protein [Halocatena marina]|nr:NUDIX hydrolase N-terminal domain-containing protein [Halocatena marina]
MDPNVLSLLDELRILGQNGLRYADNHYDEQRYRRLLELVAEYYGETLALPPEEVHEQLAAEIGHVTPKVGVGAALFDDDGKILLMKRPDRGEWNVPGGFVDPGEGPQQAVRRETREETGLAVRINELVGVYHLPATEQYVNEVVGIAYLCERTGGELQGSVESTALQYWHIENVPEWHRDAHALAANAHDVWHRKHATSP